MSGWVYIMTNKPNGILYVGVTSELRHRAWQHRSGAIPGFTKKYGVHRLVHYEVCDNMLSAISREKQLKKWNRAWKLQLIEERNPTWRDLWRDIV